MFTIDGIAWPYPCQIERMAEIRKSDISGMMMNRQEFNDILGTYMRYTVTIAVPINRMSDYDAIYAALTDPVSGHVIVMPHSQTTLQVNASVESVNDVYVMLDNGKTYWKGIQFTMVGNSPWRSYTLGEAVTLGMMSLPAAMGAEDGDTYVYDESTGTWVATVYGDADDTYY